MAKTARSKAGFADALDDESGPERTCAVTREKAPFEDLVRFVLGPDHEVVPDIKRKLPGRGVWVSLSRQCVAQAVKKQVFARGLKDKAVAAPDLPDLVDDLLRRDALQALSIANKAGLVTTGFVKVEKAIEAGDVGALLHARDGKADGKRKLGQALRRVYGPESKPEIGLFSTEEIDAALGRGHVVHAALGNGAATKVLLASCRRLAVYRGEKNTDGPAGGEDLTADETGPSRGQDGNAGDISSWDARTI
ncbi:hypothetical protein SAMN06265338_102256 [Rhodoblastus acidophilus]|uniref:YlxR domain-containing protein n=1 Tax=Rhodoblastus acidophilus TaxID=1074 RepID=A0A212R0P1_RHOAC|nr:RNA-binding protein [Rhodoblastus acidophilus]MCW2314531.1 putative RNA-binding protein YlxR (DUF448 family) [Rhodoblastus acidophilus]PPQ40436.1 hypothetical protein CKO16_01430 [Rhodoblastus acidophilus]RAI23080.1 hypothetical protein CH337_04400 [Rhodoblastus acidophilus]SNB65584.1 hypothetical protein SAMN06265338_102256 [Rhodoblastus acidophilus]